METKLSATLINEKSLFIMERGSVVYGANHEDSDIDLIAVLPDEYGVLIDEVIKVCGSEKSHGICEFLDGNADYAVMTETTWKRLLKDHDVMAIEAIYTPWKHLKRGIVYMIDTRRNFTLVFSKLRESFSRTASNSWVKAKKKIEVEGDLKSAQKSLFHSLRILNFAKQLCKYYEIVNFNAANGYYDEILATEPKTWEKYKEIFKKEYNKLHSDLRSLAPKN